jgi:Outer membrane lipoprotein carrier protein LolA-like
MREIASRGDAVVGFKETKHSALLKAPIEIVGELRFRRPDVLEKQVRSPVNERYTIEGASMTIERGTDGRQRTISLHSQPLLRALVDSIRSTLRGDAEALRKFYRLELTGDAKAWTLVLLPAGVELAEFVTVIRMMGGAGILRSMEIVEANGDRTVTRFDVWR